MFSDILKGLRTARGLTQNALGDSIGYSQQTVAQWEKGSRQPDLKAVIDISRYFGVTTDYLLGLSERESASFHNFGDVMRILLEFQHAGVMDFQVAGTEWVKQVVFTFARHEFTVFFEEYQRMIDLLVSENITPSIFGSWLGSELQKLSGLELPRVLSFKESAELIDLYIQANQPGEAKQGGEPDGEHN